MPTADDLFRPTAQPTERSRKSQPSVAVVPEPEDPGVRRTSGRIRHDEKMTVYMTADELINIEHARLSLRRDHGLAVDRGRFVREAIALALAELDASGEDSAIVARLTAS